MTSRRRYLLVTVIPILMITAISTLWAARLAPQVPDPMAAHFGPDLRADGYLSPLPHLVVNTATNLALTAGFIALARAGMWHGASARILAGIIGFTTTSLSGLQIRSFTIQTGIADPRSVVLSVEAAVLTGLASLLIGLLLAWAATPVPEEPRAPGTVPHLPIPEQGAAVWVRSEAMRPAIQIVLAVAIAVVVLAAAISPSWGTLIACGAVTLGVLVTWGWHLRADSHGLSYRSFLGLPRGHVPSAEIVSAEVINIRPGRWGGWGWRRNRTGTGLITRSGTGLRITRSNGQLLEISCTDAATAVSVLRRYSHGQHSSPRPRR